jgi:hypothetical protein
MLTTPSPVPARRRPKPAEQRHRPGAASASRHHGRRCHGVTIGVDRSPAERWAPVKACAALQSAHRGDCSAAPIACFRASRPGLGTLAPDELRACRLTIRSRSLPSAIAEAPTPSSVTTAGRPERQCAARRLGRRRRALWWRSRRMRSRSPSAAHISVPGSGAVWGSWRHRGWDQVQRLRNRHQIELGPRQRGVSRA